MEVSINDLRFCRNGISVVSIDQHLFPHGSTTALFGPNGSGKTSLLRLVAGLERPTQGTIRLGPEFVKNPARNPHVAMAFQRPVFLRGTVRDNLSLGLSLRDVDRGTIAPRTTEAANEFGIGHLLNRLARTLSGGEAQRANLARALCLRAPLTLLDEPLSGLDQVARARLLEELPQLLQTFATTTIVVTHDREEAFRLAERLVIMVGGKILASGPGGELYRHPPDRLTAQLLGYTVVEVESGTFAVPPGGLVLQPGNPGLDLLVERVVDMGNHRHVIGHANHTRIMVRLDNADQAPEAGSRIHAFIRSGIHLP
ncbi:MAG: ABC transporter ATP-binding protein [Gemmatimonadota bacterium]